jgi:hypothetical protein
VLAMLFLALLEVSLGDKQAYQTHRTQVDRLICAHRGSSSGVGLRTIVERYVLAARKTRSSNII